MLTVYIVEDEPFARDELKYLLNRTGQVELIGEAGHVEQALQEINLLRPDIVFLDLQLGQESGLSIAEKLARADYTPAVVFATADDQFALQAFELNALDYILKPFEEERIRQTLDKIKKYRIQSPVSGPRHTASHTRTDTRPELHSKIAIPQGERLILLETGEIVYAGSEEGKCVVKTAQQRYEFEGTLVELEKKTAFGAVRQSAQKLHCEWQRD